MSMTSSRFLALTVIAMALCAFLGCGRGGSSKASMEFSSLPLDQQGRLDRQRARILSAAQSRYGTARFTKTKADIPVLQRLIDDRVFSPTQTFELQSLGIVFGDVLANELGLHWELVTDEYGTDPVLRYGTAKVQVAAMTMI